MCVLCESLAYLFSVPHSLYICICPCRPNWTWWATGPQRCGCECGFPFRLYTFSTLFFHFLFIVLLCCRLSGIVPLFSLPRVSVRLLLPPFHLLAYGLFSWGPANLASFLIFGCSDLCLDPPLFDHKGDRIPLPPPATPETPAPDSSWCGAVCGSVLCKRAIKMEQGGVRRCVRSCSAGGECVVQRCKSDTHL